MLPSKEEQEYWKNKDLGDMKRFLFQKAVEYSVMTFNITKEGVIKNYNLLKEAHSEVFK